MFRICHIALGVLLLAGVALAFQNDARVKAISGKVLCDCGCREVLGDCEHKQCKRKPAMLKEISLASSQGRSDEQILRQLAAAHGAEILLTPTFSGFNTLLWIVPVTLGLVAIVATLWIQKRRCSPKNC